MSNYHQANLNRTVKSSFILGISNSERIGENIGQGTIGGALLSSLNLDMGVQSLFTSSTSEISYGAIRLQPLIFQDDLARMCTTVQPAQAGNDKVAEITNSKQLEINIDKSSFIILGNRNKVKEIREQLAATPLTLNNNKIKDIIIEYIILNNEKKKFSMFFLIKGVDGILNR